MLALLGFFLFFFFSRHSNTIRISFSLFSFVLTQKSNQKSQGRAKTLRRTGRAPRHLHRSALSIFITLRDTASHGRSAFLAGVLRVFYSRLTAASANQQISEQRFVIGPVHLLNDRRIVSYTPPYPYKLYSRLTPANPSQQISKR